jgi:hypothetical protein
MGLFDPATRKVTRLGFGLAATLIAEVQRRGAAGSRRTSDRLLLEDASGMPGPALVGPIADFDRVLLPDELDPTQAKELAVAAGMVALGGAGRRLEGTVRALLTGNSRPRHRAVEGDRDEVEATAEKPAERAAWERFVAALEKVSELRMAYAIDSGELVAEEMRWAEVELEDAVAVAGEFEVKKIRWLLT